MRISFLTVPLCVLFFSIQTGCVSLPEVPEEPLLGIDHTSIKGGNREVPAHVPVPIKRVAPRVPAVYRQAGFALEYTIVFLVGKDGVPKEVSIQDGGKEPALEKLLLEAFREWRFRPAMVDGVPTDALLKMPFTFVGTAGLR